ncbi:hypothetical protein ACH4CE_37865 [Streptomyces gelaticus]|uniref:hypothetical protein n=1 Tax=Streptomyces gelaticus TaxID=285446 RepID=UPI00378D06FB
MTDDLHRYVFDALERVLTGSGMPASEASRLARTVAEAEDLEAVTDFLLARVPKPAALIAVEEGVVYHVESGLLLTSAESETLDCTVEEDPFTTGRAVRCRVGEQNGWLYGHLDGLTIRVASGSRVTVGEALTDSMVDIVEVLASVGPQEAIRAVAERLADLCRLGPEDAGLVAGHLLDAVKIIDLIDGSGLTNLPLGSLCTRRRFHAENGRLLGVALRDLPPTADERLKALTAIPDDFERQSLYHEQRLYKVAKEAGLTQAVNIGRTQYAAVDVLAAMHDKGGCLSGPHQEWLLDHSVIGFKAGELQQRYTGALEPAPECIGNDIIVWKPFDSAPHAYYVRFFDYRACKVHYDTDLGGTEPSQIITFLRELRSEDLDAVTPDAPLGLVPNATARAKGFDMAAIVHPRIINGSVAEGTDGLCSAVYTAFPAHRCEFPIADPTDELDWRLSRGIRRWSRWDRSPGPALRAGFHLHNGAACADCQPMPTVHVDEVTNAINTSLKVGGSLDVQNYAGTTAHFAFEEGHCEIRCGDRQWHVAGDEAADWFITFATKGISAIS